MLRVGLVDADFKGFPNLALMKLSAYHKSMGDDVELATDDNWYDVVYVSRVFSDEYSTYTHSVLSNRIIDGGTGKAISVVDGKEVYNKNADPDLDAAVEHMYPDYALYPDLTANKAFGFLTRGCCNNCSFCIVSQKEGMCSVKVADLKEFWSGQKEIVLLDPNILACKDRMELLDQLIESKAMVEFSQGLDARFITEEVAAKLAKIRCKMWHFAFDFMKNENQIMRGLRIFVDVVKPSKRKCSVYMLTNYNTSLEEDMRRVKLIQSVGLMPDVRVYRKSTAPRVLRDLQRWSNNRYIYWSTPDFMDYAPRKDGNTMREQYF